MAWAGTDKLVDNFNRAQAFSATPGENGWTAKDTSSAGTPTYLCITEDGGACALTLANTSEEEIVTLYTNDVLPYDLRKISQVWWVAKVAGVDAVTQIALGVASATADALDDVSVNAWFRIDGTASTSAVVIETDDNATNDDDNATGVTLASTYKKFLIDFSQGLSDVRFFVDGVKVGTGTFSMAGAAAGQNVQPFVRVQKASGTGVPAVTIAQFGIIYNWSYGA